VRAAVDAPRMHHQWLPDEVTLERHTPDAERLAERLRAMGHNVRVRGGQGDAHSIFVDPVTGVAVAANDKRSPDSKAAAADRCEVQGAPCEDRGGGTNQQRKP